jgi:hypothetical protein
MIDSGKTFQHWRELGEKFEQVLCVGFILSVSLFLIIIILIRCFENRESKRKEIV